MRLSRLVVVLLVASFGWWLVTRSGLFSSSSASSAEAAAPVERARTGAAAASGRAGDTNAGQRDADATAPSGAISENMTPEQVQALLGPPDETASETTETGASRQKWTYRNVHK